MEFKMIKRQLQEKIINRLNGGKVIVLLGPRQVGKTTLINKILDNSETLILDGDDIVVRNTLKNINTEELKILIGNYKNVFIDESQRIENIGLAAKIIVDKLKGVQLFLSGSSSFDINEKIKEPLTGREWTFELYPISYKEWENHFGLLHAKQGLDNRLIYGYYPDIINHPEDQAELLKELAESYLFKDILSYANIRNSGAILKLTQALAYQVGSEISYNEISRLIGIDAKTVVNYIDILEKSYVVFRLNSFSKNERNEIKKGVKIYFYDNGVRNSIINSFQNISNRNDVGPLWENFLISERIKQLSYEKKSIKSYFWRTTQHQEIDYIEVIDDQYFAYEFKWNPSKKGNFSATFTRSYNSKNTTISKDNYRSFIMNVND
jgi:uncharacterized protein